MTNRDQIGAVYAHVQEELRVHASSRFTVEENKSLGSGLERIAQTTDSTAVAWRGSDIQTRVEDLGDAVAP